ncbi:MAG: hypothetical protein MUP99_02735, partial [Pedobacter sp.]|nr:hypothetical protein [Pedobacter sp.]
MSEKLSSYSLDTESRLRKTSQYLMPPQLIKSSSKDDGYDIYPVCALGEHKIFNGYGSLIDWIISQRNVVIDGYVGVFWEKIQQEIKSCLHEKGLTANWIFTADFLLESALIDHLIAPFLGEENAVWGTKCTLTLADLYQTEKLATIVPDRNAAINIIIGTGAALANWQAALIYVDLPKNELQFRMRAGAVNNLGTTILAAHSRMYKRFYFVDWVLLNKHKKSILNQIAVVADGQWPDQVNWMFNADLVKGLNKI